MLKKRKKNRNDGNKKENYFSVKNAGRKAKTKTKTKKKM